MHKFLIDAVKCQIKMFQRRSEAWNSTSERPDMVPWEGLVIIYSLAEVTEAVQDLQNNSAAIERSSAILQGEQPGSSSEGSSCLELLWYLKC